MPKKKAKKPISFDARLAALEIAVRDLIQEVHEIKNRAVIVNCPHPGPYIQTWPGTSPNTTPSITWNPYPTITGPTNNGPAGPPKHHFCNGCSECRAPTC